MSTGFLGTRPLLPVLTATGHHDLAVRLLQNRRYPSWGFEIVKNRETKEPFNVKADKISGVPLMTGKIAGEAMANGLYMAPWYDNLVIAPPLTITTDEVDQALDILDKALKVGDAEAVSTNVPASRSSEFGR